MNGAELAAHEQVVMRRNPAMQPNGLQQRLRELAAKIATEQDHDTFTALVKELNELLDGERQRPEQPRSRAHGA